MPEPAQLTLSGRLVDGELGRTAQIEVQAADEKTVSLITLVVDEHTTAIRVADVVLEVGKDDWFVTVEGESVAAGVLPGRGGSVDSPPEHQQKE
jgi:hypothetical protein